MEFDREILFEYYDFLDNINEKAREYLDGANDEITETSFEIISSIVGRLFYLNPKLLKLRSNKRVVVKPRMVAVFMLYLYLDIPSQKICDYYNISRATLIHYCETITDEYLIYEEMKEKLDKLMTQAEMTKCIRKLKKRKRSN